MPASIHGVPVFQHCRLTQSRASRLSRQPMTRSTSAKDAQPDLGDQVAVQREDGELGVELARSSRLTSAPGAGRRRPREAAPSATGSMARPGPGRQARMVTHAEERRVFTTSLPSAPAPATMTHACVEPITAATRRSAAAGRASILVVDQGRLGRTRLRRRQAESRIRGRRGVFGTPQVSHPSWRLHSLRPESMALFTKASGAEAGLKTGTMHLVG